MAMYKRYEGSFLSSSGVKWTAQIWQENSTSYTVGDLNFPADSPLIIEYADTPKHGVMCGSTATLKIISETDRKYLDLYTIKPGVIRLDVLRNDSMYWSGCLDPEHSEEPYSRSKNYDVTLTFSDFGILKRLKYNLTGMQSLSAIMTDALTRSKINYTGLNQSFISTYLNLSVLTLSRLAVRSDNFYDEEDKAMTLYQVLEGMLQPLALRMVQKAGYIYIYDLNGLQAGASSRQIVWASEDQRLGMDTVYNNVLVTFSPYAGSAAFEPFEYEGTHSPDLVNTTASNPSGTLGVECYTYRPNSAYAEDRLSFTVFESLEARGAASILTSCQYYYIEPLLGGQQSEGLAVWFDAWNITSSGKTSSRKSYGGCPSINSILWTGEKTYLPSLGSSDAGRYRIRLNTEVLLDARYNPFEQAGADNEEANYNSSKNNIKLIAIPVKIQLYDSAGNVIAHYQNISVINDQSTTTKNIYGMLGSWVSGAPSDKDCWLFYYNNDTPGSGEVMTGWISPRQAFNFSVCGRSEAVIAMDSGQYIPYPNQAGFVGLQITAGVEFFDANYLSWTDFRTHAATNGAHIATSTLNSMLHWFLIKGDMLSLVKTDATSSSADEDDIEYSGQLNENAEEALEISTICGTMNPVAPHARGLYFKSSDNAPLSTLTRQSREACPEQLLIGTMFSHYADRMDVLSGTAVMGSGVLELLTDANIQGSYITTSESQNVIADEAEIKVIKNIVDEYTA